MEHTGGIIFECSDCLYTSVAKRHLFQHQNENEQQVSTEEDFESQKWNIMGKRKIMSDNVLEQRREADRKRKQQKRLAETIEEKEARRKANTACQRRKRNSESNAIKAATKEGNIMGKWKILPDIELEQHREADRKRKQQKRLAETNEEKEARRKANTASQRRKRERESNAMKAVRKEADAAAHKWRRLGETIQQASTRREFNAALQKRRRERETSEEAVHRRAVDAANHREKYSKRSTEDRRRRIAAIRLSQIVRQQRSNQKLRHQPITLEEVSVAPQDCEPLDAACGFCGALHLAKERLSDGLSTDCCHKRKIKLEKPKEENELQVNTAAASKVEINHDRNLELQCHSCNFITNAENILILDETEHTGHSFQPQNEHEPQVSTEEDFESQKWNIRGKRKIIPDNVLEQRREADRKRKQQKRLSETIEEKEARRKANTACQRRKRDSESNAMKAAIKEGNNMGKWKIMPPLDTPCGFCGALHLAKERPSDGLSTDCCHKGKIKLEKPKVENEPQVNPSAASKVEINRDRNFELQCHSCHFITNTENLLILDETEDTRHLFQPQNEHEQQVSTEEDCESINPILFAEVTITE